MLSTSRLLSPSFQRFLCVIALIGLVCRVSQLVTVDPLSGNIVLWTRPRPWYVRMLEPFYRSTSWGLDCLLDEWDPSGLFHHPPGWIDWASHAVFGRDCGVFGVVRASMDRLGAVIRDFTTTAISDSLPAAISSVVALVYAAVFGVVPLMMAGGQRGGGGRGGGRGRRDRRRRPAGRGHLQAVAQALADGQAQQAGERDAARDGGDDEAVPGIPITLPIAPDCKGDVDGAYDVTCRAPYLDLSADCQMDLYRVLCQVPRGSCIAGVPRALIECVNEDTNQQLLVADPYYDTVLVPLDDGADAPPANAPTHVFFPISYDAGLYAVQGIPLPTLYFGRPHVGGWVWGRYACRYDNHTNSWVVGTDGFWRHGIDVSDRELVPVWGGIHRLGRTGVAFGLSGLPGAQYYPGAVAMLATTLTGPFNDQTPAVATRLVVQYVQTEGLVFTEEAVQRTVKRGVQAAFNNQVANAPLRRNATWWNFMSGFGANRPDSTVPPDVFCSCIPMGLLPALLVALVLSGKFVRLVDPPWRHVVLRGPSRIPLLLVSFAAALCMRLNSVTPLAGALLLFLLHISYSRAEFCSFKLRCNTKTAARLGHALFTLLFTFLEHAAIWHPRAWNFPMAVLYWVVTLNTFMPFLITLPLPYWAWWSDLRPTFVRVVHILGVQVFLVIMVLAGPGFSRELAIAFFECATFGNVAWRLVGHSLLAAAGPYHGLWLHLLINCISVSNLSLVQRDWRRARKNLLKRARPLELVQSAALFVATFNRAFWGAVFVATRPYFLVTNPFSSKMVDDGSEWGYYRGMKRKFALEPGFAYCMACGPLVEGYLPGVLSQSHYNVAASAATRLLRPITVERVDPVWLDYCAFVRSAWPPLYPEVDIFEPGVFEEWVVRFPPSARKIYRQAWKEVFEVVRGMNRDVTKRGLFVKVELAMEHLDDVLLPYLNGLRPKNPRAILSCSPHYNVLVGVALHLVKDRIVQYFDDSYSARFTTGLTNEQVGQAWEEVSSGMSFAYETDHTVFDAHFDYATEELMQTVLVRFGVPRWISRMMLHMVYKRCKNRSLTVNITPRNSEGMRGSGEPQTSLVNTLHNLLGTLFVCARQGVNVGVLASGDNATLACDRALDVDRAMRDWGYLRFQIKIDKCDFHCPTYCSGVFMLGKLVPKVARILTRVGWSYDAFKLLPKEQNTDMELIQSKHLTFVSRQMYSKWLGLLYVCSGHPVLDPFFRHLLKLGPDDRAPKAPPRHAYQEWGMHETRMRPVTDEARAWFLNRYKIDADTVLAEIISTLGAQVPGGPVVVGSPSCFAALAKVDS